MRLAYLVLVRGFIDSGDGLMLIDSARGTEGSNLVDCAFFY